MTDALEPAFLASHDKVPFTIRDVLLEADGCIQHGFLLGGTACARRGLEMALIAAKADGDTYEARVKSLHQKNGVPEMLTTILVQSGDSGGRDAAKLSAKALELFVATIKAVLYELYVLAPERTERLQYIRRLANLVERPSGSTHTVVAVAVSTPNAMPAVVKSEAVGDKIALAIERETARINDEIALAIEKETARIKSRSTMAPVTPVQARGDS